MTPVSPEINTSCTIHGTRKKRPIDIDLMLHRIEEAVRPFPKAAMFELAEDGYNSLFEQLIACIISIRTFDEVTIPAARRLFEAASTPKEIDNLTADRINELIRQCTFHEPKSKQIHEIAHRTLVEFGGNLPCDAEVLQSFHGVGLKCANLALGIACGQPRVSADVHVHRVTNRWGYIASKTPEETSAALDAKLPKRYKVEINRLLVPFGKHICTGRLPHCPTCPVLDMCRQVGVKAHAAI